MASDDEEEFYEAEENMSVRYEEDAGRATIVAPLSSAHQARKPSLSPSADNGSSAQLGFSAREDRLQPGPEVPPPVPPLERGALGSRVQPPDLSVTGFAVPLSMPSPNTIAGRSCAPPSLDSPRFFGARPAQSPNLARPTSEPAAKRHLAGDSGEGPAPAPEPAGPGRPEDLDPRLSFADWQPSKPKQQVVEASAPPTQSAPAERASQGSERGADQGGGTGASSAPPAGRLGFEIRDDLGAALGRHVLYGQGAVAASRHGHVLGSLSMPAGPAEFPDVSVSDSGVGLSAAPPTACEAEQERPGSGGGGGGGGDGSPSWRPVAPEQLQTPAARPWPKGRAAAKSEPSSPTRATSRGRRGGRGRIWALDFNSEFWHGGKGQGGLSAAGEGSSKATRGRQTAGTAAPSDCWPAARSTGAKLLPLEEGGERAQTGPRGTRPSRGVGSPPPGSVGLEGPPGRDRGERGGEGDSPRPFVRGEVGEGGQELGVEYTIRDLDTGKLFLHSVRAPPSTPPHDERAEGGLPPGGGRPELGGEKVLEMDTGRELSYDEFEMGLGVSSSLVREMERRERAGGGGPLPPADGLEADPPHGKAKGGRRGRFLRAAMGKQGLPQAERGAQHLPEGDEGGVPEREVGAAAAAATAGSVTRSRPQRGRSKGREDSGRETGVGLPPGGTRVKVKVHKKAKAELDGLSMTQVLAGAHRGAIWSAEFNSTGRFLATGGQDGAAKVWEVLLPPRAASWDGFESHAGSGADVGCQPESGGRASGTPPVGPQAAASWPPPGAVRLEERPVRTYIGHTADILDLSWTNTRVERQQYLLTASMDRTVRLWHTSTDACLRVFPHDDFVTCVAFCPRDNTLFCSGSLDHRARLWSIPDACVACSADTGEMLLCLAWLPSGTEVVLGTNTGVCRFYGVAGGELQLLRQLEAQGGDRGKRRARAKRVTGIQALPGEGGLVLVTSNDSRIRLFGGAELRCRFRGHENSSSQMRASLGGPEGRHVACASEDSRVYLYSVAADDLTPPARGGPAPPPAAAKKAEAKQVDAFESFPSHGATSALFWPGVEAYDSGGSPPPGARHQTPHRALAPPLELGMCEAAPAVARINAAVDHEEAAAGGMGAIEAGQYGDSSSERPGSLDGVRDSSAHEGPGLEAGSSEAPADTALQAGGSARGPGGAQNVAEGKSEVKPRGRARGALQRMGLGGWRGSKKAAAPDGRSDAAGAEALPGVSMFVGQGQSAPPSRDASPAREQIVTRADGHEFGGNSDQLLPLSFGAEAVLQPLQPSLLVLPATQAGAGDPPLDAQDGKELWHGLERRPSGDGARAEGEPPRRGRGDASATDGSRKRGGNAATDGTRQALCIFTVGHEGEIRVFQTGPGTTVKD